MKTFIKLVFCTFLVFFAVSGLITHPAYADVDFIDYYDCSNKPNGNYYHPTDCTKFITCSNGYASERNCAACNPGDPRCPEGRTNFDEPSDACLLPEVARCVGGQKTSFFDNPLKSTVMGSIPTTGNWGNRCRL